MEAWIWTVRTVSVVPPDWPRSWQGEDLFKWPEILSGCGERELSLTDGTLSDCGDVR